MVFRVSGMTPLLPPPPPPHTQTQPLTILHTIQSGFNTRTVVGNDLHSVGHEGHEDTQHEDENGEEHHIEEQAPGIPSPAFWGGGGGGVKRGRVQWKG